MAHRDAQNMHKKALSEVASIVDMIAQEDWYEIKIRHEWRAREAKVKYWSVERTRLATTKHRKRRQTQTQWGDFEINCDP